ncbi:GDSL esterase/lipase At1g09390 [Cucumis sativus]|uniref:Uncharacterized protein n=1 Tax=Cucumis sativus TaxID=3659 RepID=A0A0A0L9E0_CUCSA|nr:GDSL esterase/lipase At1g09390 [Cucumis sativus]KGN58540.1 hypothetical protein Csa_001237 [Cucumis sativus]
MNLITEMEEEKRDSSPFPLFLIFFLLSLPDPLFVHSQCIQKPVIFNFGDSNSDTGGFSEGLGIKFGLPTGRTFFHKPAGRLCDGRLMIDFLCESVNSDYLTPYLRSVGPNFTNGANFAISGSATLPKDRPFNLYIQIMQFLQFQSRSLELIPKGYKDLVDEEGFNNALYTIDIGQNDLAAAFTYLSYPQVIQQIPSFVSEIKNAIWTIYQHGGRNFWIHNTGPLGCLPQKLATAYADANASDIDNHGCLQSFNNAAKEFNTQLRVACGELRSALTNATLVYVDVYAIKYDLITNSVSNGFENPLIVCCGYGGPPYNFNQTVTCGQPGFNTCNEGLKYVSWDGVHYTEAANAVFASMILSSQYSSPKLPFNFFCNK